MRFNHKIGTVLFSFNLLCLGYGISYGFTFLFISVRKTYAKSGLDCPLPFKTALLNSLNVSCIIIPCIATTVRICIGIATISICIDMPARFSQGTLQSFKLILLSDSLGLSFVNLVKLLIRIAVIQILVIAFFITKSTYGSESILIAESTRHFIHLISCLLGISLGQLHIYPVGGHGLLFLITSERFHDEVYEQTQRNKYDRREYVLRLFEINFSHHI